MTDDERAYRLRCTQLLIDLKGTPHEAQALLEGWGRDERRRAYTEVLGEARRRAEATPQIEYIAALALLALADWCEYKQQAEEEGHG